MSFSLVDVVFCLVHIVGGRFVDVIGGFAFFGGFVAVVSAVVRTDVFGCLYVNLVGGFVDLFVFLVIVMVDVEVCCLMSVFWQLSCRMLLYRFGRVCLLIFFICKASGVSVPVCLLYSGLERRFFGSTRENVRVLFGGLLSLLLLLILLFSLIEKTHVLT